jgi:hypothetical protein
MCPTADGFDFVSEIRWNSAYYGAMAVASSAAETIQKKTAENIALPVRLWRVARGLHPLVELIENPQKASSENKAADPHKVVAQLDSMISSLDELYRICKRKGFTNRTLTAGSLSSIRSYTETIREFTEYLKLILDPGTPELFRKAREDRKTQGTESMSSVLG